VFRAVVDSDSFSTAAARLGISRAGVTKHINRLESHLQVRLMERTTRSLRLTEAGSRYYARCAQILDDLEQAEREVSPSSADPVGTLRINAPHSFATAHIAPFVAEFVGKYPKIKLDISLTDRFVDFHNGSRCEHVGKSRDGHCDPQG
jgi:DNA-binding transcriptional LysR family regulator